MTVPPRIGRIVPEDLRGSGPTVAPVRARTGSMQAVAALDLDLAERFDDIVATVGSAG